MENLVNALRKSDDLNVTLKNLRFGKCIFTICLRPYSLNLVQLCIAVLFAELYKIALLEHS